MKITVEYNTDDDDFQRGKLSATQHVMDQVTMQVLVVVRKGAHGTDRIPLRDRNGNRVGHVEVES